MNQNRYFFVTLLIIICVTNIKSQVNSPKDSTKVFYFKGRVVNEKDNPLVFAHVINKHRGHATITDSTGYFRMVVILGDTLRFSSIGYHTQLIPVIRTNTADTAFHIIRLNKREYDLPTVDIYELRWQVFKSEFMEEEVEEDKIAKNISFELKIFKKLNLYYYFHC